jgi:hypothetical protein
MGIGIILGSVVGRSQLATLYSNRQIYPLPPRRAVVLAICLLRKGSGSGRIIGLGKRRIGYNSNRNVCTTTEWV